MKKIALLGPHQTYSERCMKSLENITHEIYDPLYCKTIYEVMKKGLDTDYTILPFENTLEGYVQTHMDLLINSELKIKAEMSLSVSFDYIWKGGAKRLYVQYAAKNQCLKFMESKKDLDIVITNHNRESYERFINDPLGSAIIPSFVKDEKGHREIEVADEMYNHTRFLILSKNQEDLMQYYPSNKYKLSCVITPYKDRPGLLFDLLKEFAERKINLISIMSRPTKKQIGNYHFFIEMVTDKSNETMIEDIFNHIKDEFDVKILGVYQSLIND